MLVLGYRWKRILKNGMNLWVTSMDRRVSLAVKSVQGRHADHPVQCHQASGHVKIVGLLALEAETDREVREVPVLVPRSTIVASA